MRNYSAQICNHLTALFSSLDKSRNLFLLNFANGGLRECADMSQHYFSSSLTLRKKSKFIFAKFREWWFSRTCQQDTALFFVLLDAQEKVELIFAKFCEWWTPRIRSHNAAFYAALTKQKAEIQFCRVPQVVAIVNMLSLQSAFFRTQHYEKSQNLLL